jgi:hypothetical protein
MAGSIGNNAAAQQAMVFMLVINPFSEQVFFRYSPPAL